MDNEAASTAKPTCILVLQGGGAMGAYHIGALQALQEHPFEPDWVCGISIGAINGAIIAGNPPGHRLTRLEAFWESISRPSLLPPIGGTAVRRWEHALSYFGALTLGQPGFFTPRPVNPYLAPPGIGATSFYDTAELSATLAAMVDFNSLDERGTRLSVGATDVETGSLVFFDTHHMTGRFGPEHVVASGSLPPGFPATEIDGRFYWDGGCVSNTPLRAVLDDPPPGHAVVFVIDLWSASGAAPDTMAAVDWRSKQIRYASITPHSVEVLAAKLKLRHARRLLGATGAAVHGQRLDLVHIIYHPGADQIPSSDAEFSRESIAERRAAGLADMRRALAHRPWETPEHPDHLGCILHVVDANGVTTIANE